MRPPSKLFQSYDAILERLERTSSLSVGEGSLAALMSEQRLSAIATGASLEPLVIDELVSSHVAMKILFLTHRLPYAPNRGDRIRAYHTLRHLARNCEIHLFSFAARDELPHVLDLRTWLASVTTATPSMTRYFRAAACLTGDRPLTHLLLDAPTAHRQLTELAAQVSPDIVFTYCSGMARFAVEGPLNRLPCVIDMVDVDSRKWAALGEVPGPLAYVYRREARLLSRFEGVATRHAAVTLVVSAGERGALRRLAPSSRVEVIELGVDTPFFTPTTAPSTAPELVFCGVMNYPPNVEGALWFVSEVLPRIRTALPDTRLTLVGSHPTRSVRRLARHEGVLVTGTVADVRPYLWRAAVGIAPLLTSRGVQNKVLEALAAGLPVVTTPTVASALPGVAQRGCKTAATPEEFAAHVVDLLRLSAMQRRELAAAANIETLSWEAQLAPLTALLREAAGQEATA